MGIPTASGNHDPSDVAASRRSTTIVTKSLSRAVNFDLFPRQFRLGSVCYAADAATAFPDRRSANTICKGGLLNLGASMTSLRTVLAALGFALVALASLPPAQAQPTEITIDATAAAHAFPHFWEVMFGSGRAILALRDNYRRDIQEVHDQVGQRYVRFHAILHDEVGLYDAPPPPPPPHPPPHPPPP